MNARVLSFAAEERCGRQGGTATRLTVTRVAEMTGVKRRTLRSWIDRRAIAFTQSHPRLQVLDARFVDSILTTHRSAGGEDQLVPTGVAAGLVGVDKKTFYNYVMRGIPVPHIEPSRLACLVENCPCLRYDRAARKLLLTPFRFVEHGYGYLDRSSMAALRILNHVVVHGWVPMDRFVKDVAKRINGGLSLQELPRLHRKVAVLCARERIRSGRGLNSRKWYIEPRVADRETLLFLNYVYRDALVFISPERRLVEGELRDAVRQGTRLGHASPRAALYSMAGLYAGFLHANGEPRLATRKAEAASIPKQDLQKHGLGPALDALRDGLITQRRSFLPICTVPDEGPWKVLSAFCRRKLCGRQFRRTPRRGILAQHPSESDPAIGRGRAAPAAGALSAQSACPDRDSVEPYQRRDVPRLSPLRGMERSRGQP
jgi:hypothetical protein